MAGSTPIARFGFFTLLRSSTRKTAAAGAPTVGYFGPRVPAATFSVLGGGFKQAHPLLGPPSFPNGWPYGRPGPSATIPFAYQQLVAFLTLAECQKSKKAACFHHFGDALLQPNLLDCCPQWPASFPSWTLAPGTSWPSNKTINPPKRNCPSEINHNFARKQDSGSQPPTASSSSRLVAALYCKCKVTCSFHNLNFTVSCNLDFLMTSQHLLIVHQGSSLSTFVSYFTRSGLEFLLCCTSLLPSHSWNVQRLHFCQSTSQSGHLLLLLCGDVHPNPSPAIQADQQNVLPIDAQLKIGFLNIFGLFGKDNILPSLVSNYQVFGFAETCISARALSASHDPRNRYPGYHTFYSCYTTHTKGVALMVAFKTVSHGLCQTI
jgi:hypothetical protein